MSALVGAVAIAPVLAPMAAYAEPGPIVVTTTDDSGAGSLRAALAQASGSPEDDLITFAPTAAGRLLLTSGALEATVGGASGDLTIEGPGADRLTIDADGKSRVLDVRGPGGDVRPQLSVSGLTLTGGRTGYGYSVEEADGGGVRAVGTDVEVDQVTVSASSAADDGGGVAVRGGSLLVAGSQVTDNDASLEEFGVGGGLFLDPAGAAGVALDVRDSTISANRAGGAGGGLGSELGSSAPVTVTRSSVSGNEAFSTRFMSEAALSFGEGGGIAALDLTLVDTTVAGNSSNWGGGIVVEGSPKQPGSLRLTNTTVADNQRGGGVATSSDVAVEVGSSTIAGNAGVGLSTAAETVLRNTVLAGNTGGDLAGKGSARLDHSLVQDAGTVPVVDAGGSLLGADPRLGALGDHGGPTATILPAPNSPAVDAGAAFGATSDQRGSARPALLGGSREGSDGSDMGSVEITTAERARLPQVGLVARPAITGTPRVGRVLHVSAGSWEPADVALTYQWLRDGMPIKGATSSSYTIRPADFDRNYWGDDHRHQLSVRVTAGADGYHDGTTTTRETAFVGRGRMTMSGTPVVRGRSKVGSVLRAKPRLGTVVPRSSGVDVQWIVGGQVRRDRHERDPLKLSLTRNMRGERVTARFMYSAYGYRSLTKVVRMPARIR